MLLAQLLLLASQPPAPPPTRWELPAGLAGVGALVLLAVVVATFPSPAEQFRKVESEV